MPNYCAGGRRVHDLTNRVLSAGRRSASIVARSVGLAGAVSGRQAIHTAVELVQEKGGRVKAIQPMTDEQTALLREMVA